MAYLPKLIVFAEARQLIRLVFTIDIPAGYGGLRDQIRRAAVSTAGNIAEGSGAGSDKQLRRYLRIAHGSVNETYGYLLILTDMQVINDEDPVIKLAYRIGGRLASWIKRTGSG